MDQRINYERELRIEAIGFQHRALKIQAREYERRLHQLNGEAVRIREVLARSVSREVYDANQKAMDDKLDARSDARQRSEDIRDRETEAFRLEVRAAVADIRQTIATGGATAQGRGQVTSFLFPSLPALLGAIATVLALYAVLKP